MRTNGKESPGTCGDCSFFQPGIGGGDRIFCRAPLGLALGPRKPESQCLKPEYFRPQDASDEVGTFEDTIPLPIE